MHSHWSVSSTILLFAVLALVVGLVLALSVVTKRDCEVEADRANTTRATLLLLVSFSVGVLVLATQRLELGHAVKSLME